MSTVHDGLATNVSCSECGTPSYVRGRGLADVDCEHCGNEVNWQDFQLDDGESLVWDDDGYLAVMRYTAGGIWPGSNLDFSPCDCTSLTVCSRHED